MSVKLLLAKAHVEGIRGFDVYRREGGYQSVEKALKQMNPESIVEEVKKSGLRGRGGAGFPAGMKWSFIAKPEGVPRHLVCNADESEPGTFKDRYLMEFLPHLLIEGLIVSSFALGSNDTYIYIRGEYAWIVDILEDAINEAKANGFLGKNILGTGFDCEIHVHRGAGAYICGEETALIESLEGKRGNPRIKPPFPAVAGLFGKPTTINNVETLATVPYIIKNGAEWYKQYGRPDNPRSVGTKLFSVCGNISRPGNYEVALGFPFKDFLYDLCGGPLEGREIKAVIPGGSSVPILTREEAEGAIMDYEGFVASGTMLGSGGLIVFDDRQDMVRQIARLTRFYAHESCAQCTQCREGTAWITRIMERIRDGLGTAEDLDTLVAISDGMTGKTICVLSDSCATPVLSGLKKFRHEFEAKIAANKSVVTVPGAFRASAA